jgi:hypothetical protein
MTDAEHPGRGEIVWGHEREPRPADNGHTVVNNGFDGEEFWLLCQCRESFSGGSMMIADRKHKGHKEGRDAATQEN